MITLADIARQMNLSTATISNALTGKGRMKEETRQHIQTVAGEMGYEMPHPAVHRGRQMVIITEAVEVSFCGEIVCGLTTAAKEAGVSCALYNLNILKSGPGRDASAQELRPLIEEKLAAHGTEPGCLIYISQYPRRLPELFTGLPCPVAAVFCHGGGEKCSVNYDDQQGAYQAVSYLIASGCRQIAMISGPVDSRAVSSRMIGYQQALIDHGLPFHPKMVWIGDWEVSSGRTLAQSLLSSASHPDAIFSQNDAMAFGVLQAAREAGLRVPEDLSVIGFDNTIFANMTFPRLTSVAPPFHEMGRAAFEAACRMLEGKAPEQTEIVLPCALNLRETTLPAR